MADQDLAAASIALCCPGKAAAGPVLTTVPAFRGGRRAVADLQAAPVAVVDCRLAARPVVEVAAIQALSIPAR
jgi:hypothetical protein